MHDPKISVFYCPLSCNGKYKDKMNNVVCDLRSASMNFVYTELADESYEDIKKISEGSDIIIIGGGDGTVNRVINATYLLGAEYIILPFGSGNDFSRGWNISEYKGNIIETIKNGRSDMADLWVLNDGQVFVQSIFLGISINVIKMKNEMHYKGYTKAILKSLRTYRGENFEIITDERCEKGCYLMTSLQNVKTTCNGMYMTQDSDVSDGILEVEYCTYEGFFRTLKNFISTKKGWLDKDPNVGVIKTKHVIVKTDGPITYTVDGEIKQSDSLDVKLSEHKIVVRHL